MIIISSSSLQMLSIMLSISTCLLLFGGVESATTSSSSSSLMAFHFQLPHHQHNLHSTSTSPSSSSSTTTLSFVRGDILGLRCRRTNTSSASSRRRLVASRLFLSSSSGSGFGNNGNNNNKSSQKSLSSSSSSSLSPKNELFELQELRAQLQTILKQNIPFQSLSKEKREELSKYVYAIVDKATSPINVSGKDGNTMGIANFVVGIENKSWRMVFTTDSGNNNGGASSSSSLPAGSTVILRVGEFLGMQGKLDYVLKYGERIMGLNELVAKSTCSVDVSIVALPACRV